MCPTTDNREDSLSEFFVQYHITHRCNLNCLHCYQKNYSSDNELSTTEICSSIEKISEMVLDWKKRCNNSLSGIIQLTGGEPFVRDDWEEIVDCCLGNSLDVILMTNGTLLPDKVVSRLKEKKIQVQVSLDGVESTHDKIRGKNSYQKTMQGISTLLKWNINCIVSLTLMKLNIGEINRVVADLKKVGIFQLGISRYLPNTSWDIDNQVIETKELKNFYSSIVKKNKSGSFKFRCRDPLFHLASSDTGASSDNSFGGCSIGFWGFCILPNGDLIPCSRLNLPIGNIKENSLRDVWANSKLLWKFREFRNLKGKCSNCRFQNSCRGCRAVAYAINGDYLAEDPQCWLPANQPT